MKIAIAIYPWMLPIFTEMLEKEGYTFIGSKGLGDGMLFLNVETDDVGELQDLVIRMVAAADQQNQTIH